MTQISLFLDSHIDIPWPDEAGSFYDSSSKRQVTLPKMKEGGMNAACFAAYIPQGRLDSLAHEAAQRRADKMLDVISQLPASSVGEVRLCATPGEVEECSISKQIAVIPAIENGYAIGENPLLLDYYKQKKISYMTLTHNGHNALADSAVYRPQLGESEVMHHGLSSLGKETVKRMNQLGLIVDISHTSRATMLQVVSLSEKPVIASHSSIRALCDHPRNLDDTQLMALKENGGLIQITALDAFLLKGGGSAHLKVTLQEMIEHIGYAVKKIGIKHVGVSSDFEGGGGIVGWSHAGETHLLIQALFDYGFDSSEVSALCGKNFLRVWREVQDTSKKN